MGLPPEHRFPARKYGLLRESLEGDSRFLLRPAELARPEQLARAHDPAYVDAFVAGRLDASAQRRIGFPWSRELVARTMASAGATLGAAASALRDGCSGALAGGTHHAFYGEGAGFCVFNDIAVAIQELRATAGPRRFAVIDLDVHQGDGTAQIFADDADVFTLSIHGRNNFPFRKQTSSLDIPLEDGTGDAIYLEALEGALPAVERFEPEAVFYQAGVDVLEEDTLGKLSLSMDGVAERDRQVFGLVKRLGVPLVITMGGGYARPIERTAEAHAQTYRVAAEMLARP